MSVAVAAREIEPGDTVARRRPLRIGGGYVPGEVKAVCPPRGHDNGLVELVGEGWSWALPGEQTVVRIAARR